MIPYILLALLALIALGCAVLKQTKSNEVLLANEGTHGTGLSSYMPDATTASRYLIGKIGSDSSHVAVAGVSDIPLGVITDEVDDLTIPVNVAVFGATLGSLKCQAAAAIAAGDFIAVGAAGQIRTLPTATGTYYIIGRALQAATAQGDIIEFAPCLPNKVSVA